MKTYKNICAARLLAILAILSLLSGICHAPAGASPQPKTYEEILKMTPGEFANLDPGQAMDALNRMSQSGEKKLNEFFREYARTKLGIPADFIFDSKGVKFSIKGLNAPNNNFLEFDPLKQFIKSKQGQAVSVMAKDNGFEIITTSSQGTKTLDAQGFEKVTFKEGKINLDGNLVDPGDGRTLAKKESDGAIGLDGQGTITPKAGKEYAFHGKSALHPDGKALVEPDPAGMNWVKVEGQKIIPKHEQIAVYTDAQAFNAEKTYNKVLITTKEGRAVINPARQLDAQGKLSGEFDIIRSVNVIGPDGKAVASEERITFTPSGTTVNPVRGMSFDSLFSQLQSEASNKNTYLRAGRTNNPSSLEGLQKLLGIVELDVNNKPIYGEKTKEAVMKFQRENGLTGRSVDGVVGPTTYNLLSKKFNNEPSAVVVFESGNKAYGISDNGLFSGKPAAQMITTATSSVPRMNTARYDLVDSGGGRYSLPGGFPRNNYVPSQGTSGYTPDLSTRGSWALLDRPPEADDITRGRVTYYYTPVWDLSDTTGSTHTNWREFMKAVKMESSGLVYKDGKWYHVNYNAAKAYLERGQTPSMELLTEKKRFGEVSAGGTPLIGSIAAPPEVRKGSKAYVKTVGGKWVELKVVDRGKAIQKTGGVYHIDVWAGVGKLDYNKGAGSLSGQYRIPSRPQIHWVYP